jgi:hypothetical protein
MLDVECPAKHACTARASEMLLDQTNATSRDGRAVAHLADLLL